MSEVFDSPAVALILALEARGVTVRANRNALLIDPKMLLTPADDASIRAHRAAFWTCAVIAGLTARLETYRAEGEPRHANATRGMCGYCGERSSRLVCWRCILAHRCARGVEIPVFESEQAVMAWAATGG